MTSTSVLAKLGAAAAAVAAPAMLFLGAGSAQAFGIQVPLAVSGEADFRRLQHDPPGRPSQRVPEYCWTSANVGIGTNTRGVDLPRRRSLGCGKESP